MREIHEAKAIVCWLFCGAQFLFGSSVWAAEVEPDTDLIKMIADCISEKDRDTRALGLQYVRDPKEVPGTAATKKFAGLLTTLPTEGRAGLLEALGDRGDKTALPAVLNALTSDSETVRSAALRAVGLLGSAEEVPLLADKVAAGSDAEQQAAKAGLIRIGGDGVNAAVVAAMTKGKPNVRAELLGVLAARNAKETLPSVLAGAGDAEASVRLAALGALRFLADEKDTAAVVKLLKTAQGRAERQKAPLTLMTVCSRGREKCVPALVAGMSDADVPGRTALLLSLARRGGPRL